jgi:hypothetical protein
MSHDIRTPSSICISSLVAPPRACDISESQHSEVSLMVDLADANAQLAINSLLSLQTLTSPTASRKIPQPVVRAPLYTRFLLSNRVD